MGSKFNINANNVGKQIIGEEINININQSSSEKEQPKEEKQAPANSSKEAILERIQEGEAYEAINLLNEAVKKSGKEKYRERAILLSSRYNYLKKEKSSGQMTDSVFVSELNKLQVSTMDLAGEVFKD